MRSRHIVLGTMLAIAAGLACFQRAQRTAGPRIAPAPATEMAIRQDEFEKIKVQDGKTLLWAKGTPGTAEAEWFDITGSPLERRGYQHGIGKDKIAAIDAPFFLHGDDPALKEFGITDETQVIGYVHNGEARAYPIPIMNRHELVNDVVGGKPVTVGW